MAFFSSFGKKKTSHWCTWDFLFFQQLLTVMRFLSGTSMAAPQVSGVAALMIGLYPEFKRNPKALKQRLMNTSDITSELRSKTQGGGRLNAFNAVNNIVLLKDIFLQNLKYGLQ